MYQLYRNLTQLLSVVESFAELLQFVLILNSNKPLIEMTSKGGHSKLSSTALRLAKKVWCGCCKKLLSNTSDSDNEIFLRNHVRQCKESPKKKLVPSVSVDRNGPLINLCRPKVRRQQICFGVHL